MRSAPDCPMLYCQLWSRIAPRQWLDRIVLVLERCGVKNKLEVRYQASTYASAFESKNFLSVARKLLSSSFATHLQQVRPWKSCSSTFSPADISKLPMAKKGKKQDNQPDVVAAEVPNEEEESNLSKSAMLKAKRAAKKAKKPSKTQDSDDDDKFDIDTETPVKAGGGTSVVTKTKPINAFEALNNNAEEEEEDDEQEEESAAPSNGFSTLALENNSGDDSEDLSKKKKKTSNKAIISKKVQDDLSDDEDDDPKMTRKEKKRLREERKKEKKSAAAKAELSDDEQEEPEAGQIKRSSAANYAYASGQKLGPDGTNPADGIAITGNLVSPDNSKDLQIDKLTVQAYGKALIKESDFSLVNGRRYGLIAPNGSGKSTLLHAIACGLVPRPAALDVYLLDREYAPTEQTSIEAVLDIVEREQRALEDEMSELLDNPDKNAVQLDYINSRLQELTTEGGETKVKSILKGLGFREHMYNTLTKDLSGGWRMRIALARILFVKPTLMMLDEPTNHLDLEAVVWLEEYLLHETHGQTLILTSHSQDTLNEVCTDIIHLHHQQLYTYPGNYDSFTKVRAERDVLLAKRARKQEKELNALKGKLNMVGSEQQKQAQRKVKAMDKRQDKEKAANSVLEEELIQDKELVIKFQDCGGGIPSPAIKFRDVDFAYPGRDTLLHHMSFGLGLDSRIALVGPNGAGKTTLLKLILGKLEPTTGDIQRDHHLRLSHFHQHMGDQLEMNRSAVDWLCAVHPTLGYNNHTMRGWIGKYGLTGKSQVIPMRQLSDGQRRRVLFAHLGLLQPHMLCFDEPTNALDLDTIDALATAINTFDGGALIISHDFRLIEQVAESVWIVNDGEVTEFGGTIRDYKEQLKRAYQEQRALDAKAEMGAGGAALAQADRDKKPVTVLGL